MNKGHKTSRVASRYARIAARVAADIQHNMDTLNEAVRETKRVPGVDDAELYDWEWDGHGGIISVGLPVKEWHEEQFGMVKTPVQFEIRPEMLASRVMSKLKEMGLKVMKVILPEEMRGFWGKPKGYDRREVLFEVVLAGA